MTHSAPTSLRARATDFDGTLAHDGTVGEATLHALDRLKAAGFRLILVTGRELHELKGIFPEIDRFDAAVMENGAVLFHPATGRVEPLSKSEAFMDRLSKEAMNTDGKHRWQKSVKRAAGLLHDIFWPDHFILGGGNARHLDPMPEGCERGENQDAFRGALRLWPGADLLAEARTTTWRITRRAKKKEEK